jgi:hypothetical protein
MFTAIKAFFSGVTGYAYLAVGLLILALAGTVAFQYQQHKADVAQAEVAKQKYEGVSNALAQSEADKADLARKAQTLDGLLTGQKRRADALQITNSKLADQLHALESTLPQADQDCSTRPLPDALLEWLRNGSDSH